MNFNFLTGDIFLSITITKMWMFDLMIFVSAVSVGIKTTVYFFKFLRGK